MEPLEQRALLSVVTLTDDMTFKSSAFTASGSVTAPDFALGTDYTVHLTSGTATLSKGTLTYTSLDDATVTNNNNGTAYDAVLSGGGSYKATGKNNFTGSWKISHGYADDITVTADTGDVPEQLSGSIVIDSSSLTYPGGSVKDIFNGTYTVTDATFDTSNFSITMDLVNEDTDTTLTFTGKVTFSGSAFAVAATSSWNDGSVDVDVTVTGKPHTTADRDTAVGSIALYWSPTSSYSTTKSTLATDSSDTIPIYWNEATASYTVSDLTDAPAGTTYLLVVSTVDGKSKVSAALPYAASIAADASTVDESDGTATFTVTLPCASAAGVTVYYTTVKGTATPGVDYGTTKKEVTAPPLVIDAGDTSGQISIPVINDTTYEGATPETFSVKITKVVNAGLNKTALKATTSITDDDPLPTIVVNDSEVTEPTKGTTKLKFEVTLSNPSYQKIQVKYATQDGTALAGEDYVKTQGTLTFNPGKTTASFNITVKTDKEVGDETFYVNFTLVGTNADLSDTQAAVTIKDTDDVGAGVKATGFRDAALGQLAAYFEPLGGGKSNKDTAATDSVLAAL